MSLPCPIRRCSPWNSRRGRLCVVVVVAGLLTLIGVMFMSATRLSIAKYSFWDDSPPVGPTAYFLLVNVSDGHWDGASVDRLFTLVTCPQQCSSMFGDRVYVLYYPDSRGSTRRLVGDRLNNLERTCTRRRCPVRLTQLDVPDGSRDALTLNDAMMDAYLGDEFDNFYVVLSARIVGSASPVTSNVRHLVNVLRTNFETDASAIAAEFSVTSATEIRPTTMPTAVLFTRTHFEIFGLFFPRSLPDLRSALTTVVSVYRTFNMTVEQTGSDVIERDAWSRGANLSAEVRSPGVYAADCETMRRYLDAVSQSPCFRCPVLSPPGQSRVISMSLYGANRRYTMGAVRNAQLAPVVFPGWRLRFYVDPDRGAVPGPIVARLLQLGAEFRHVNQTATGLAPMMWRFTIVDDPDVDIFVVRDCDSRLTSRDVAVVADWLKRRPEATAFHCVRDHPSHSGFSVSGGLWGGRRAALAAIFNNSFSYAMRKYSAGYIQDMHFLGREVWPRVQSVAFCHDSFSCSRYPSSHPFPVRRIGSEHLGQVFDQYSVGRQGDIDKLNSFKVVDECNPP